MDSKDKLITEDLLKPDNMLRLYASGAFPMAESGTGNINWYMPETRCIIPLDSYNIPRSLRKTISSLNYEIRFDTSVQEVIRNCASREETWISEKLISAYTRLQKRGHVHSVETWIDNKLSGGLYGITFRGAFFGESMFSLVSQASKIALMHLLERLRDKNFRLLDVQYITDHLKMFGAIEIDWVDYKSRLQDSHLINCEF